MRTLFVALCLLAGFSVAAQSGSVQAQIDSLVCALDNANRKGTDSVRVGILAELAFQCMGTNPLQGVSYAQMELTVAQRTHSKDNIALACYNLGGNYCVLAEYPSALNYFLRAQSLYEDLGSKGQAANCMMNVGKVYTEQKKFKLAIDNYWRALTIFQQLHDREGIAYAEGDMGSAYLMKEDYASALIYYRRALAENTALKDKMGIAGNLGNIANALMKQNLLSEALPQFFEAAKLYRKIGETNNYMIVIGNIGDCYLRIAANKEHKISGPLIPPGEQAIVQKAIVYLHECLSLATELGNQKSRESYSKILSEAEERLARYQDALEHYKLYSAVKDSVFSMENARMIENLTTARDTLLKRKDIELQDKKIALAQLEEKNERIYFVGALLLICGAILVGFYNFRVKTRTRLLQASIQGEEEERMRIAAELHDDIGATLSSVRLFLTHAEMRPDINLISQSKVILDDSIQKIRDLSHQLQPRTLQYLGLAKALESLAELISRSGLIRMNFIKSEEQWPEPETQIALSAYRIIQELVNNIVKHARASTISLTMLIQQGRHCIKLEHDGLGLTEDGYRSQLYKKGAIGLKNIENRLQSAKIALSFSDPKSETYSITLCFP